MRPWLAFAVYATSVLFIPPAHAAETETWHTVGKAPVEGRLTAVYGSVALISNETKVSFVPLSDLTDDQLKRVVAFLAAKPAVHPTWGSSTAQITKTLRGKLDSLQDGRLQNYDPSARPEPDVYLIYFSAHWCPPCQAFTPTLVEAYNQLQQVIPQRFELIYVSNDHTAGEQERYAREAHMPWPVLKYSELRFAEAVQRWAGDGIPCLVALTPDGKVIFHTYHGDEYLGPGQVVDSFATLVPMLKGTSTDIRRARHRLSVLQHLSAIGNGSSPPKPYLIKLNPAQYQTLTADQLMLALSIDEQGRVKDVSSEPKLSPVLYDQLSHDTDDWLFLPAVENGKPVAQTVMLPLQFDHGKPGTKTAANN